MPAEWKRPVRTRWNDKARLDISPSAATFRDHRYAQMSTVFLHHLDHRRALRVHRHRGCSRRNRKDSIFYLPRDLRDLSRIGPNGGESNILRAASSFFVRHLM